VSGYLPGVCLTVTLTFTTVHSGISPTAWIQHRLGMGDSALAEINGFKNKFEKENGKNTAV
jgi:hypothetical protein